MSSNACTSPSKSPTASSNKTFAIIEGVNVIDRDHVHRSCDAASIYRTEIDIVVEIIGAGRAGVAASAVKLPRASSKLPVRSSKLIADFSFKLIVDDNHATLRR